MCVCGSRGSRGLTTGFSAALRLLHFSKKQFGGEWLGFDGMFPWVHTQLWVKSPNREGVILFQVTVSRQGEGDADGPVHSQLGAIAGQQVNRDGCDRSQLKSLFCPCTREKQEKKLNQRESDWEWGIPGTRLQTAKTQMKGEFRDEKERKANKGKAGKTGRSMKTHRVEMFRASVCVFPGGRGSAVRREPAPHRTERHVQHGRSQMSRRGSDHPLFPWVPNRKVEPLLPLALHLFYLCV